MCVPLIFECEDALIRHRAATPLEESDLRDLIDYVCSVAIQQDVFFLWRPQLKDPGDDSVLELAAAVLAKVPELEPETTNCKRFVKAFRARR